MNPAPFEYSMRFMNNFLKTLNMRRCGVNPAPSLYSNVFINQDKNRCYID